MFHNDVIAVGHRNVLFCHEQAFPTAKGRIANCAQSFGDGFSGDRSPGSARERGRRSPELLLFNSQLLSKVDGNIAIVVPQECRNNPRVSSLPDELVASGGPIDEALIFDLRQSMMNGGGPACLIACGVERGGGARQFPVSSSLQCRMATRRSGQQALPRPHGRC